MPAGRSFSVVSTPAFFDVPEAPTVHGGTPGCALRSRFRQRAPLFYQRPFPARRSNPGHLETSPPKVSRWRVTSSAIWKRQRCIACGDPGLNRIRMASGLQAAALPAQSSVTRRLHGASSTGGLAPTRSILRGRTRRFLRQEFLTAPANVRRSKFQCAVNADSDTVSSARGVRGFAIGGERAAADVAPVPDVDPKPLIRLVESPVLAGVLLEPLNLLPG